MGMFKHDDKIVWRYGAQALDYQDKVVKPTFAAAGTSAREAATALKNMGDAFQGSTITAEELISQMHEAKQKLDEAAQPSLEKLILQAGASYLKEIFPEFSFELFIVVDNASDMMRLHYKSPDGLEIPGGERVGQIIEWSSGEREPEIAAKFAALLHQHRMRNRDDGARLLADHPDDNPLTAYEGGGDW